ncbi:MAG: hypothetical protein OXF08_02645 [Bacteroidetes bacterium]|nr:hypothetical protein [Bacteroidota bacterium]
MDRSETDQNLAGFIAHLHEVDQLSKSTIAPTIAGIRFAYSYIIKMFTAPSPRW